METDMQRDGGRYEIGLVVDEIEDVLVQCSSWYILIGPFKWSYGYTFSFLPDRIHRV